jgi:uncharacterized protein YdaU (DUF1376 family)
MDRGKREHVPDAGGPSHQSTAEEVTAVKEPKVFMPLFISDYMADTCDLSAEEHGAHLLLLMSMWRRGGSLPNKADRLARIASVSSDRWPDVWAVIGDFFDEAGDQITQKRLTRELDAARERMAAVSRRGRRAARQRWGR